MLIKPYLWIYFFSLFFLKIQLKQEQKTLIKLHITNDIMESVPKVENCLNKQE